MEYAKYIDHTLLRPESTKDDIDKLICEALKYGFKTICVNSSWVEYAKAKLGNSKVQITSVVGFPLGAMSTIAKSFEAAQAIADGADEIDMVMNIGRFKSHDYGYVLADIKAVKASCGPKVLKVIVETALLNAEEIKKAAIIVLESGADFVKTSTGFSSRGALPNDIKLIKQAIGDKIAIKASGGIKTLADIEVMIELGASRIGTSSGAKLLEKTEVATNY